MRLGKHVLNAHDWVAGVACKTCDIALVLGIDDELFKLGREVLLEAEPVRDAENVRLIAVRMVRISLEPFYVWYNLLWEVKGFNEVYAAFVLSAGYPRKAPLIV